MAPHRQRIDRGFEAIFHGVFAAYRTRLAIVPTVQAGGVIPVFAYLNENTITPKHQKPYTTSN